MKNLFEAEHDYVRKSDLKSLEILTDDKIKISQSIGVNIQKIERIYNDLYNLAGYLISDSAESKIPNLSNIRRVFQDLRSKLDKQGINYKIETFDQLDSVLKKVISFQQVLSPKIEMNIYLTNKLLDHHRETYRFWQEIALESSSVYGEKGDAKPQTSVPILSIKA